MPLNELYVNESDGALKLNAASLLDQLDAHFWADHPRKRTKWPWKVGSKSQQMEARSHSLPGSSEVAVLRSTPSFFLRFFAHAALLIQTTICTSGLQLHAHTLGRTRYLVKYRHKEGKA